MSWPPTDRVDTCLSKGGRAAASHPPVTVIYRITISPNVSVQRSSGVLQASVDACIKAELERTVREWAERLARGPTFAIGLSKRLLNRSLQADLDTLFAEEAFTQALSGDLDPNWIEVWSYVYRGNAYDALGQRDRAVAEYDKAIDNGNDYDGAQEAAQKYRAEPYRPPAR